MTKQISTCLWFLKNIVRSGNLQNINQHEIELAA